MGLVCKRKNFCVQDFKGLLRTCWLRTSAKSAMTNTAPFKSFENLLQCIHDCSSKHTHLLHKHEKCHHDELMPMPTLFPSRVPQDMMGPRLPGVLGSDSMPAARSGFDTGVHTWIHARKQAGASHQGSKATIASIAGSPQFFKTYLPDFKRGIAFPRYPFTGRKGTNRKKLLRQLDVFIPVVHLENNQVCVRANL